MPSPLKYPDRIDMSTGHPRQTYSTEKDRRTADEKLSPEERLRRDAEARGEKYISIDPGPDGLYEILPDYPDELKSYLTRANVIIRATTSTESSAPAWAQPSPPAPSPPPTPSLAVSPGGATRAQTILFEMPAKTKPTKSKRKHATDAPQGAA